MLRSIVHIDLNAFFAQCEENRDLSLRGKPVAVGGDHKRGIVSTANYEARKYGVGSAMPMYLAKKKCPDLVIVEGHYSLYSQISRRFMRFLKNQFPMLEQVSIDECYLDMTDYINDSSAHDFLADLQLRIYSSLRLKCSIGYAHTKFLAKKASDYKKPMGLTLVMGDDYKKYFWPMSIDKMWGVGKKTAPRLKELGIMTIGDLATSNRQDVKDLLGIMYDTFYSWANGKGDDKVISYQGKRQSISSSITLLDDSDDVDSLKEVLRSLTRDVSSQLEDEKIKAHTVVVTIRNSAFQTHSKRAALEEDTWEFEKLYLKVISIFLDFYKGEEVRLLGVGIEEKEDSQKLTKVNLFDKTPDNHEESLLGKLNTGKTSGLFTTLGDLKKGKK